MSEPTFHETRGHRVYAVPSCGIGCHGWCADGGDPCHTPGVRCVVCGITPEGFQWPGRADEPRHAARS